MVVWDIITGDKYGRVGHIMTGGTYEAGNAYSSSESHFTSEFHKDSYCRVGHKDK